MLRVAVLAPVVDARTSAHLSVATAEVTKAAVVLTSAGEPVQGLLYKLADGQCVNEVSRPGKKYCKLNPWDWR